MKLPFKVKAVDTFYDTVQYYRPAKKLSLIKDKEYEVVGVDSTDTCYWIADSERKKMVILCTRRLNLISQLP